MPRVIHFQTRAANPDGAVQFYSHVFGWTCQKWTGPQDYWRVSTGDNAPGINGGLLRRSHPGAGTVNTVDVTSVDDAVGAVTKAGGTIIAPKMAIPGVGYPAYCQDPEGNTFGVMQADPAAA